jgi:hypothetical protein
MDMLISLSTINIMSLKINLFNYLFIYLKGIKYMDFCQLIVEKRALNEKDLIGWILG